MNRRTFMMKNGLDQVCVDGVNYSVQPDNEIWYTTIDNNKADAAAVLTNYAGDKATQILAHIFENGIWKVKIDRPVKLIPESYIRYAPNIISISLPKQVYSLGAWSMGFRRFKNESPNLRNIIFCGKTPTQFNSQFQCMTAGNLNIYVPRGEKEAFIASKIISGTPSNRVYEWGRI
jgi:hypothetical protein